MGGRISLERVKDILDAEVLWPCDLSITIESVGAADLMSDVLALGWPGMLLLTGLANVQAVRTADVADIRAVVFVRGKKPAPDVIELAEQKGIPLLTTSLIMFEAAGLLYAEMCEKTTGCMSSATRNEPE
jgi:predicted transcriptional regulator